MKRSISHRGFTLLEVLVAVALVAVVITAVYETFSIAERAYTAYRDYAIKLQQLRTALSLFEEELKSSFYNEKDPFSVFVLKTNYFYDKKLSQIEFTTIKAPQPPLKVSYYVKETTDDRLTLYKEITTVDGNKMQIAVLEGIEYFTIFAEDAGKELEIYDARKTHRLPMSLKIKAAIVYKQEPIEIAFTVKLQTEVFKW